MDHRKKLTAKAFFKLKGLYLLFLILTLLSFPKWINTPLFFMLGYITGKFIDAMIITLAYLAIKQFMIKRNAQSHS